MVLWQLLKSRTLEPLNFEPSALGHLGAVEVWTCKPLGFWSFRTSILLEIGTLEPTSFWIFESLNFGNVVLWRFGTLWNFGALALLPSGSLELRRCGPVDIRGLRNFWTYGNLELTSFGHLGLCKFGDVVRWYFGFLTFLGFGTSGNFRNQELWSL